MGCLTWIRLQQLQEPRCPFLPACAVASCVQRAVWLAVFGIFNISLMLMRVFAHGGCANIVRESELKVQEKLLLRWYTGISISPAFSVKLCRWANLRHNMIGNSGSGWILTSFAQDDQCELQWVLGDLIWSSNSNWILTSCQLHRDAVLIDLKSWGACGRSEVQRETKAHSKKQQLQANPSLIFSKLCHGQAVPIPGNKYCPSQQTAVSFQGCDVTSQFRFQGYNVTSYSCQFSRLWFNQPQLSVFKAMINQYSCQFSRL